MGCQGMMGRALASLSQLRQSRWACVLPCGREEKQSARALSPRRCKRSSLGISVDGRFSATTVCSSLEVHQIFMVPPKALSSIPPSQFYLYVLACSGSARCSEKECLVLAERA